MNSSGSTFANSCMTMLSAALGGTVALITFAVITLAILILCCILSFAVFQDTMDDIEQDLGREPPPPVIATPLFEQPEPGQPKE